MCHNFCFCSMPKMETAKNYFLHNTPCYFKKCKNASQTTCKIYDVVFVWDYLLNFEVTMFKKSLRNLSMEILTSKMMPPVLATIICKSELLKWSCQTILHSLFPIFNLSDSSWIVLRIISAVASFNGPCFTVDRRPKRHHHCSR